MKNESKLELLIIAITIVLCFVVSKSTEELSNMLWGVLIYTLVDILRFAKLDSGK